MSDLLAFLLKDEEHFRRARLASLYSDFRQQRATNRDGYVANINAWMTGLAAAAKAGLLPANENSILTLSCGPELLKALETREWGQPAALEAVVDEALYRGDIVNFSSFLDAKTSLVSRKTGIRPQSLVLSALGQLGLASFGGSGLTRANYVLIGNLEDAAQRIATLTAPRVDRIDGILSMLEFRDEVSKLLGLKNGISQQDLSILLKFLAWNKKTIAFDERVVKLQSVDGQATRITAQDRDIAVLKSLIVQLETQCTDISAKIENSTKELRAAIAAKNRIVARRRLKSRRTLEALLESRTGILLQLEDVLAKVKDAASQVEIVGAIQSGTRALRAFNAEVGGAETVENVFDTLGEEIAKTREIESALEENAHSDPTTNQEEIEAELETLELEDKTQKNQDQDAAGVLRKLQLLDSVVQAQPSEQVAPGQEEGDGQGVELASGRSGVHDRSKNSHEREGEAAS